MTHFGARVIRITFDQGQTPLMARVQIMDCPNVCDAGGRDTCYTHQFDVHIQNADLLAREIAEVIAHHTIMPTTQEAAR